MANPFEEELARRGEPVGGGNPFEQELRRRGEPGLSGVVIPDPSTAPGGPNAPSPRGMLGGSSTRQAGEGFVQGLARAVPMAATLPADLLVAFNNLVNSGIDAIPGAKPMPQAQMTPPSQAIADLFSKGYEAATGVDVPEPGEMTPQGRIAREIGTGVGIGGGIGAGLNRVAQAGKTIPMLMPQAGQASRVSQPGLELARDVAGGAGAGTGVGATAEALPKDIPYVPEGLQPIAHTIAALLAGIVGGSAGSLAPGVAQKAGNTVREALPRSAEQRADVLRNEVGALPPRAAVRQSGSLMQESARRGAPESRQEIAPSLAAENIGRVTSNAREAGITPPTSGAASGNPLLASLENQVRMRHREPFVARDAATQETAAKRLADVTPEGMRALSPGQRMEAARAAPQQAEAILEGRRGAAQENMRRAEQRAELGQRNLEAVQSRESTITEPVRAQGGAANRERAAQDLDKTLVEDTLKPRTTEKNRRFEEAATAAGGREVRSDSVVSIAQDIERQVSDLVPQNLAVPTEFTTRLKKLAQRTEQRDTGVLDARGNPISRSETTGGTVQINDLTGIRPHVKRLESKARASGNFALADNLGRLRSAANREIDALAERGGPGSEEMAAAQQFYREEYAPFFKQGTGGKLKEKVDKADLARTEAPASSTANMFLFVSGKGGATEAAADLERILSIAPNRAAGVDAAKRYLMADLASKISPTGKTNINVVRKWMQANEPALSQVSGLRKEFDQFLNDLVNHRELESEIGRQLDVFKSDLKQAINDQRITEGEIRRNKLSLLIDKDPQSAVEGVMRSGDKAKAMKQIMNEFKDDPEATKAWQTAVADWIRNRASTSRPTTGEAGDVPSWPKVHELVDDPSYQAALAEVYKDSPDAMLALRQVHESLKPFQSLNVRATARSDTAENLSSLEQPLEIWFRFHFGHLKAGGIMKTLRMVRRMFSGADAVDQLMTRAQLEPELAQHILRLKDTGPAELPSWGSRLRKIVAADMALGQLDEGQNER